MLQTHKQYCQRANLCIFHILSHLLSVFMLLDYPADADAPSMLGKFI